MRKAAFITLVVLASTLVGSCANTHSASSAYFGVSDRKASKKRMKEFKKPKHKIDKVKANKHGN
jgi:hypothetical protein